jgi:Cu+-exporting ATPase
VLDKTGTITEGKPVVTEVISQKLDKNRLLQLAASVEAASEHPLAKAVVEAAKAENLTLEKTESFFSLTGMGVMAKLGDDEEILVGNPRLMKEKGVELSELTKDIERLMEKGQTPMIVAVGSRENGREAAGIVSVADVIKPTSKEAVERIKGYGIRVCLLTGDNHRAAEYIGKQAGVDEIIAEVLPDEKAKKVEALQKEGKRVMMVGDGINDAPALVQADVGCAIGSGSDVAIESGDIVLMKSDLRDVAKAIRLSRLTIANIKENLFWAFFYNIIGIPIAAGVLYPVNGMLLSPMLGGFAMSLSSVCVVTNALRLRTKKL